MKRGLSTAALLFSFMFVTQVFAQATQQKEWSETEFQNKLAKAKAKKFTGTVVSHDPVCHCVVVKTPTGELTLQDDYAKFMQKYDRAKGLIIGAKVHGSYKTVNHIRYLIDITYVEAASTAFIPTCSARNV